MNLTQHDLTPGDLRADLSPSVLPQSISLPAEENSPCGCLHLCVWKPGRTGTRGLEAEWQRLSFMDHRFTTVLISLLGNFLGSPEPFPPGSLLCDSQGANVVSFMPCAAAGAAADWQPGEAGARNRRQARKLYFPLTHTCNIQTEQAEELAAATSDVLS